MAQRVMVLISFFIFGGSSGFAQTVIKKVYKSNAFLIESEQDISSNGRRYVYISVGEEEPKKLRVKKVINSNKLILKPTDGDRNYFSKGMEVELVAFSAERNASGQPSSSNYVSSEQSRASKPVSIGLKMGFVMKGHVGFGGEFGYGGSIFNPIVSAMQSKGMHNIDDEDYRFLISEVEATSINLESRIFLGNSLYLMPGLSYHQINTTTVLPVDGYSELLGLTAEAEINVLAANLSLGNIWTFESGYYIGAEWVGLSFPVSSNSTTDVSLNERNGEILYIYQDAVDSEVETYSKSPGINLAVFTTGFRF